MSIPTPHIQVKEQGIIAKRVLMPGDPLRAKYIAETFLEDVVQFNGVRGMLGFTGTYKGQKISVMGSGMGMPSIGIYSYELYNVYRVENIIRIGSCGSYSPNVNVYDVIVADNAYSESSYAKVAFGYEENIQKGDEELLKVIQDTAKKLNYPIVTDIIHSSDVFYRTKGDVMKDVRDVYGCVAVEMESFALFANARKLGKKAACILTVSDSLITHEETTSEERQTSFNKMMEIALETAATID